MAKQKMEKTRDVEGTWRQACEDLEWASSSEDLRQKFVGEFIVVHDKTVVAHACDRREALAQAMHSGYRRRELVVVPMLAPDFQTPPDNV